MRPGFCSTFPFSLMPVIRYRAIVVKSFHSILERVVCQKRFVTTQAKRENRHEDLQVIRTSLLTDMLLDSCIHRPESMQIISLLHQRRRHGGIDLRRGQPLVPHLLLNHGHRHAGHERIHHMAVPENMGRDLPPGDLLPGRDLLDPGLFCQAIYGPQHRLGAQMSRAPAGEEPLLAGLQTLLNGLQSSLAHPGGPEVTGLRSGALDSDEPVMKIYVRDAGSDQLSHPAAQVVKAEEDQSVSIFCNREQ